MAPPDNFAALARRVARLEKNLPRALGEALGTVQRDLERGQEAAISKALDGALRYRGTWDGNQTYDRGAAVTHSGSLWIACGPVELNERPGRGPAWRLAVKQGKASDPTVA